MRGLALRIKRLGWPAIVLACLLAGVCGCGDGDNDDGDSGGSDLLFHERFEGADALVLEGAVLGDKPVFLEGLKGNGLYLGDGSYALIDSRDRIRGGEGTVAFWIRPKQRWNDGTTRHIFSVGSVENFGILKDPLRDRLSLFLHGTGISKPPDQGLAHRPDHVWGGGWQYIAVTWKGLATTGGQVVLYGAGEPVTAQEGYFDKPDLDQMMLVGRVDPDSQAEAVIDELMIFSRAMSKDEIAEAYDEVAKTLRHDIVVYPTPQSLAIKPQPGFQVSNGVKIVVPQADVDSPPDGLVMLLEKLFEASNVVPLVVGDRDYTPGTEGGFIALGTLFNNSFLYALAEERMLPATPENPGPDGYLLEVFPDGIAVVGSDTDGALFGTTTLIQILTQHPDGNLPAVVMVDYPDMPVRAVHVFGGWVLDQEQIRRIRYFSMLKLSAVVLETTGYFHLDDEGTRRSTRAYFDFVREHGMEPIPELQSFGHAQYIIHLCQERFGVDCSEAGSTSYCPSEPVVYDGIMYPAIDNVMEVLDPDTVHFGHDEIVLMNADERCTSRGLTNAQLFAEDVNRLYNRMKQNKPSAEMMMWADMVNGLHNNMGTAEALGSIPRDIVLNPWIYTNITPLTSLFAFFSFQPFIEKGFYFTGSPGEDGYIGAVEWALMIAEHRSNAIGLLNAIWTDKTLENRRWLSLPIAAEFGWSYNVTEDLDDLAYDWVSNNADYGGW